MILALLMVSACLLVAAWQIHCLAGFGSHCWGYITKIYDVLCMIREIHGWADLLPSPTSDASWQKGFCVKNSKKIWHWNWKFNDDEVTVFLSIPWYPQVSRGILRHTTVSLARGILRHVVTFLWIVIQI